MIAFAEPQPAPAPAPAPRVTARFAAGGRKRLRVSSTTPGAPDRVWWIHVLRWRLGGAAVTVTPARETR